MIDFLAGEGHFEDHLRPIWEALPPALRGRFLAGRALEAAVEGGDEVGTTLVASHGDLKRARILRASSIAYLEHGAGQSYGGDPGSARHASYAGGEDHEDVGLFLVPGPHPASRWRAAYPDARVEMVGCPRLDRIPRYEPDGGDPLVVLSFHYHAMAGCDESNGLFRWYRAAIPVLAKRFRIAGHAHPRWATRVRPWFRRAGVPFIDRFDDVLRTAAVYAVDNSSTLFEFAAVGRQVVVLNGPLYRRGVDHGLRFWSASHVGVNADPKTIGLAIELALADRDEDRQAREHALSLVYAHRSGAAPRAAGALIDWARERRAAA